MLGIELLILVADGETVKLVIPAALDSICLICTDLFTLVLEKVSKPLKKTIIHQYQKKKFIFFRHTFKMINVHFAQIIQPCDVIVITVGICDAKISLKITKELLKIRNNIISKY